jgi:recombinational DNA repair protein RecT
MNKPAKTNSDQIAQFVASKKGQSLIEKYAPSDVDTDKIRRTGIWLMSNGPEDLEKCRPSSIIEGVLQACHDGVDLTRGEGYLIPYPPDVDYRPKYTTLVRHAEQSDRIDSVRAHIVREGEELEIGWTADGAHFEYRPTPFASGDIKGAVCVIRGAGEGEIVHVETMGREELEQSAEQSGNPYDNDWTDAWHDWFGEMAKKTVTRRALKWVDTTPELDRMLVRERPSEVANDADVIDDEATAEPPDPNRAFEADEKDALEPPTPSNTDTSGDHTPDPQSGGAESSDDPGGPTLESLRRSLGQTLGQSLEDDALKDAYKDALRESGRYGNLDDLTEEVEALKRADNKKAFCRTRLEQLGAELPNESSGEADDTPTAENEEGDRIADVIANSSRGWASAVSRLRDFCEDTDEVRACLTWLGDAYRCDPGNLPDVADLQEVRDSWLASPKKLTELRTNATK